MKRTKTLVALVCSLVLAIGTLFSVAPTARATGLPMVVDTNSLHIDTNLVVSFDVSFPGGGPTSPGIASMSGNGTTPGYDSTNLQCATITHCMFQVQAIPPELGQVFFTVDDPITHDHWVSQQVSDGFFYDVLPARPTVLLGSSGFDHPENLLQSDGQMATKIADTASFTMGFEPPAVVGSGVSITLMTFTPYFLLETEMPDGVTCQAVAHTNLGDINAGQFFPNGCGYSQGSGDNAHFGIALPFGVHTIDSITYTVSSQPGTNFPVQLDYFELNGFAMQLTPNSTPVIAPLSGGTINTGQTYSENGSFSDDDSTSWAAAADYGDGSGMQPLTLTGTTFVLSHQYSTAGNYTVTVNVTDDHQNTATQTTTVAVNNSQPVTVTFNAVADTYVRSGNDNHNQGVERYMTVQSSGSNRGLVRFDQAALQAIIGSHTVISATLQLTIVDNGNNWSTTGRTVDVHRMLVNWIEGNGTDNLRGTGNGATWNCAVDSAIQNQSKDCSGATAWEMGQPNNSSVHPWFQTPSATQTITNNQSGVVTYDVTSDVVAFMNGTPDYGWLIKKTNEGQTGRVSFGSRESAFVPLLVITYQP